MKFEAIKWTSVDGKETFYVQLTKGNKKHNISVGEKTFKAVQALEQEKEQPEQKPGKQ